jgi:hypothetical protein
VSKLSLTLRQTRRTVPIMFSMMLVQASERRSDDGSPSRITVSISLSPSRMLAETPVATCSSRRARLRSSRSAFSASSGCRGDPAIAPCLASRRGVGLQQDACLQQLTGWGFALLDQHVEPITLLGGQPDDVFLDDRLLRGHDTSPEMAGEIDSEFGRRINDGGY